MQLYVKFSTEPNKEDWPSSVQQVTLPAVSTGATSFVTVVVNR